MRDIATFRRALVEESSRETRLRNVVKRLDEVSKHLGELVTNIPHVRVEWPNGDKFALIFDLALDLESDKKWDMISRLETAMEIKFHRVGIYQQAFLPDGTEIAFRQ